MTIFVRIILEKENAFSQMNKVSNFTELLASIAHQDFCYLTTNGRRSGRPHEIEIWFGVSGEKIYLLSGGRLASDWVKNLMADPSVGVRIAKQQFSGIASLVRDSQEDAVARRLLAAKYYRWKEGQPLNKWARTAKPVAIVLNQVQN